MEEENTTERIAGEGIAEVKAFADMEGRQVKQFIPIDGEKEVFKGFATVNTQQGQMPFEFSFPDEYKIRKCFEEFDAIAQEELDKYSQEMAKQQSNIVVPK